MINKNPKQTKMKNGDKMYQIIRFYADKNRRSEVIKTVETKEEAVAHCHKANTVHNDKENFYSSWFDGFKKVTS